MRGGGWLFHIVFHIMGGMLTVALSVAVLAIAGASIAALWRAVGVLTPMITRPELAAHLTPTVGDLAEIKVQLDELKAEQGRLTIAISEGIARVDRHEKRIQKTVTSARRLVRDAGLEHAGIEAEHSELQPPDADGNDPLPALPEQVEATRIIRFPGGSLEIGAA